MMNLDLDAVKCDMAIAVDELIKLNTNDEAIISTSGIISKSKIFNVKNQDGIVKKFLNVFLFDDSVNKNGVKLSKETIDNYAQSFVNYPLILNSSLDHSIDDQQTIPSSGIGYLKSSLQNILEKQKQLMVGLIRTIEKKIIPDINKEGYYASVELIDPKFIRTIEDNPQILDEMFTSSSLVGQPTIEKDENGKEILVMNGEIKPLNITIVANPAYGKIKSMIRGYCSGPEKKCMELLSTSAIDTNIENKNKLLNLLSNLNIENKKDDTIIKMTEENNNSQEGKEKNQKLESTINNVNNENKQQQQEPLSLTLTAEPELTLEEAKKIIKKLEVEVSLTKDQLAQKESDSELIKKHEQELKEYRFKDKIHKFKEILGPMIKDSKKLEERATEYARDEAITEKILQKIVNDSLLIVSTSATIKEEPKNDMMSLADSLIVSTSSTLELEVDSKKPSKAFNESLAGFYANLL